MRYIPVTHGGDCNGKKSNSPAKQLLGDSLVGLSLCRNRH